MRDYKADFDYSDETDKTLFWDVLVGQFGCDDIRTFKRDVILCDKGIGKSEIVRFFQAEGLDAKRIIPVTGKVLLDCLELLEYCDRMRSTK